MHWRSFVVINSRELTMTICFVILSSICIDSSVTQRPRLLISEKSASCKTIASDALHVSHGHFSEQTISLFAFPRRFFHSMPLPHALDPALDISSIGAPETLTIAKTKRNKKNHQKLKLSDERKKYC